LKRNERKIQILSILSKSSVLSAFEIRKKLNDTTISSIMALLLRYHKWGLVKRKKYLGIYQYSISQKGIERFIYLKNNIAWI